MVMTCPSFSTAGPTLATLLCTSTTMLSAPDTQGLPMPRATTAACEVLPPREVSTPWAAKKPWMSSGLVSSRTRMIFSPALPRASAVSASKTIIPEAAPGDAGRPVASGWPLKDGSSRGTSSCSSISGGTRSSARRRSISPSRSISTEVRTSASAFILPLRVCSAHSLPRSMVNSKSCTSR